MLSIVSTAPRRRRATERASGEVVVVTSGYQSFHESCEANADVPVAAAAWNPSRHRPAKWQSKEQTIMTETLKCVSPLVPYLQNV